MTDKKQYHDCVCIHLTKPLTMKLLLLLVFSITTLLSHGQASLRAMPDTFTVLQASVDTFDLAQNDSIPLGDSVCITLLDNTASIVLADCHRIRYSADSFITGIDTLRYVLCHRSGICDTAEIIIFSIADPRLLPIAHFDEDTGFYRNYHRQYLFDSSEYNCLTWSVDYHKLYSTSANADSVSWSFLMQPCSYNPINLSEDTVVLRPAVFFGSSCKTGKVLLRFTAYNRFGFNTLLDTSCFNQLEGISEIPLSGISLYPSPADRILHIDMQQNTDDISTHYSCITITNALGQKARTITPGTNKLITLNVADLPEGVYIAAITGEAGSTRMLGRFSIDR